jgi:hypothetical protein
VRGVGAICQAGCIVIGEGVLEPVWQRISAAPTVGLEVALELLSAKAFRCSYFILTGGASTESEMAPLVNDYRVHRIGGTVRSSGPA